jgi:hypothetical protein
MAITITGVKRESDSTLRPGKHGNVIEWTEVYTVQTTNIETSHVHVMSSAVTNVDTAPYLPSGGIPVPQLTVSSDGYGICQSTSGRRLDTNVRIWEFTSTWSSEVKSSNSTDANVEDVESIVPLRKVLFEPVTRYRTKDLAGQPYANGAGTLFNPPLAVEDELSRWEFSQFEPIYEGPLTGGKVRLDQPTVVTVSGVNKVRPPGIYEDNTYAKLIGVTDDTIHYFNGCINSHPFRYKAEYTLKLSVRDSNIVRAYGKKVRLSEYTITHDSQRWFDKPLNVGPYFLAPKLDANGNPVVPAEYVKYEYIYFTKDVEDKDTILSQDEAGPLGGLLLGVDPDIKFYKEIPTVPGFSSWVNVRFDPSVSPSTTPFMFSREIQREDGFPIAGFQLVTGANGKKTYRAKRPTPNMYWPHIERLNHFVMDFGDYLRVM